MSFKSRIPRLTLLLALIVANAFPAASGYGGEQANLRLTDFSITVAPNTTIKEFKLLVESEGLSPGRRYVTCPVASAIECSEKNGSCKLALINDEPMNIEYYDSGGGVPEHYWGYLKFSEEACRDTAPFTPAEMENVTLHFNRRFDVVNTSLYIWVNDRVSHGEDCIQNALWGGGNCLKYVADLDKSLGESILVTDDLGRYCETKPCSIEVTSQVKLLAGWNKSDEFVLTLRPGAGEDGYQIEGGDQSPYLTFVTNSMCTCSSGACCDGCGFRNSSIICGSGETEYCCTGNGRLKARHIERRCSGGFPDCNGYGTWGEWYDARNDSMSCGSGVKSCGIECSSDTDCGVDGFSSGRYCLNGNVVRDYMYHGCDNPSQQESNCYTNPGIVRVKTCAQGCFQGRCLENSLERPWIALGNASVMPYGGNSEGKVSILEFNLAEEFNAHLRELNETGGFMSSIYMGVRYSTTKAKAGARVRELGVTVSEPGCDGKCSTASIKIAGGKTIPPGLVVFEMARWNFKSKGLPDSSYTTMAVGKPGEKSSFGVLNVSFQFALGDYVLYKLSAQPSAGAGAGPDLTPPPETILLFSSPYAMYFLTSASIGLLYTLAGLTLADLALLAYLLAKQARVRRMFTLEHLDSRFGLILSREKNHIELGFDLKKLKNVLAVGESRLHVKIHYSAFNAILLLIVLWLFLDYYLRPFSSDGFIYALVMSMFAVFFVFSILCLMLASGEKDRLRRFSVLCGVLVWLKFAHLGWNSLVLGVVVALLIPSTEKLMGAKSGSGADEA